MKSFSSPLLRLLVLSFSLFGSAFGQQAPSAPVLGTPGKLQRQVWYGLNSNYIGQLTASPSFYQAPSSTSLVDSSYTSIGDAYGARIRGYVTAPSTGLFTFWISGDDEIRLSLSPSSSKWHARPIAGNSSWTHFQSFDQFASQRSAPVFLKEGERYYLEAFQKEGYGGDHLSLAWAVNHLDSSATEKNWATSALGAVATASSNYWNLYPASNGIDSNPNTFFCTAGEANNWWMVNFGQARHIHRVTILNRQDCCQTRASNFRGELLDANQQVIAFKDFYVENGSMGSTETWILDQPVAAQHLRFRSLGIHRDGSRYLHFAEVQAHGLDTLMPATARQLIPSSALHAYSPLGTGDEDDDGFPDAWERTHGFSVGYETGDKTALADPDADGRSNLQEFQDKTNPFIADGVPGFLTRQSWLSFPYYSLAEARQNPLFFQAPQQTALHNSSLVSGLSEYSAGRVRGFVTPSETGFYRFWIASGESAEFWLSLTADSKYHKQLLSALGSDLGTGHGTGSWDSFSSQMSREVWLEAGKSYFMEANYQIGHGGNRHVNLAWAKRGGARSEIPAANLTSYFSDRDDNDDNLLPDAWEQQHGIHRGSGPLLLAKHGEFGDFDGDGLTNREEYVLGTNPALADSDGDGVSDYDEVHHYKTSPTQNDSITALEVPAPALTSYNTATTTANWQMLDGGLMADSFRSKIEWSFTVPADGWWVIDLNTRLRGTLRNSEEIDLGLRINGKSLAPQKARFHHGGTSSTKVITPFLTAGTHTFELDIRNEIGRRNLQILSLKVLGAGGYDGDNNGRPDWLDAILAGGNTVLPIPSQSLVSPLFIEGASRHLGAVRANSSGQPVTVTRGLGDLHWFANIPLQAASPTSLDVVFENKTQSQSIEWTRWNALGASALTIRQGDSVKIGAWLSPQDSAAVTIAIAGHTQSLTANAFIVKNFAQAGTYPLTVTHNGIPKTAATITVLGADFGAIPIFYASSPSWRSFANVPLRLSIVGEPSVTVHSKTAFGNGQWVLLNADRSGSHTLAARLPESGAIVALAEVSTIGFSNALRNDAAMYVGSTADGFRILRTPVMVTDLPPGGKVVITIFRAGVTFMDGTTVMQLSAENFRNGIAYIDFRYPANMAGGYCHYTDVFDATGRHLGRR